MNAPDIATCGTCGRSWDFSAYHWPASLCPFCVGDADEAAQHEVPSPTNACPAWCTRHLLEEDIDGSATNIHRGSVTRGDVTVAIETSPSGGPDCLPIVLPDITDADPAGARDLAAALLEAARLIEGDQT